MVKKKDQKKAIPLRSWEMQDSQKQILVQAQKRYDEEVKIVRGYQREQFMRFLAAIKKEIGIPDGVDVRFIPENVSFVEVPPKPPQPKISPITQDLSKIPG